jgi:hypothetical protein
MRGRLQSVLAVPVLAILAALPASIPAGAARDARAEAIVIDDVSVVPMDRDGVIPHQTVVIRGDRIEAIQPGATRPPAGAKLIDLSRYTVLPVQIYTLVPQPDQASKDLAYGAILLLLVILVVMNAVAIYVRNRYQRRW